MAMKKKSVPERGTPPPCAETPPAPPAIGEPELADILDAPAIQSMMDAFFALEKIGMAIVDLRGRVLVATGWQDICTKFHRAHPEACKHCVESDVALSAGIAPGEFKLYRCQNNLWDMATPIVVGGRHVGNLFLGQFFFDDEPPDAEIFRTQARRYGFDEPEYLAALDRVPRWCREKIDRAMAFYAALARQISALGYRNLQLAQALGERQRTDEQLRLHAQLLDGVRESVVASDLEGRILYWGRGAEKLYGYTAEEVLGRPYRNFAGAIEPPDEEAFRKAILAKGAWQGEHRQKNRGGETFWTSTFISLFMDEQGRPAGYIGIDQDITDRKQTEETLRESEERFRQVAETAEEWIWEMDAAGVYTYSNPVVEQILGYKPEELVGKIRFHELFAPQVREEIRKDAAERAARKEAFRKRVNPVVRKDGRIVILETTGVPILDPEGHLAGYRGADTDVTRRMRAEEALRKSEAQLSNALEMAHAGHWEYDVASGTFTFNDNFYRIFHTTAEQMGGYRMAAAEYARRFCHPDDMAIVDEETRKALESADPGYNRQFEHRILYADGTTGHIAVRFFIVKDAQGRTVKTYGVNQDVTERKQVEEALQESEALYRSILNASPDNITIADLEGRILMTSPSALAMLRCKRDDQLVGRPVFDFIVPEDRERAAADLVRMFEDPDPTTDEYRALRADGSRFDVEVNGEFIRGSDGLPLQLLLVIRDVTDRKRIAEKLRDSEVRYRTFIDASSDLVFLKDEAFRYVISNRANCAFLGKPEEDVIGRTDFDFMPQKAAARCRDSDQEALRQGKSVAAEEAVDGKFFQAVKFPVALPDGRVGVGGYIRDITRQKKTDEEIRQLSKFPSENPNPVLRVDRTGRILFANEAGTPILDAWKRKPGEIVPAGWLEKFARTFASGQNAEVEIDCAGHVFSCILTPVPGEDYANLYGRDITARKQAEEKLQASTERFRDIAANIPGAIYQLQTGRTGSLEVSYMSSGCEALFERPLAGLDFTGLLFDPMHVGDRALFQHSLAKAAQHMERWSLEFRVTTAAGKNKWLRASANPRKTPQGAILWNGVLLDITELKLAEESLREREAFQTLLMDTIPSPVFYKDRQGRYLGFNKAFETLYGKTKEQLVGKSVFDIAPPELAKIYHAKDLELLEQPGTQVYESAMQDAQGGRHDVIFHKASIIDAHGSVAGLIGILLDVTERKRTEENILQESLLNHAIIDSIPGTFYMLDEAGNYRRWSKYQQEQIVGQPDERMRQTNALATIHPDDRDRVRARIENVLRNGVEEVVEGRVLLRGGPGFRWLLMTGRQMVVEGRPALIGIGIDITERKEAEEQVARQLDELRRWQTVTLGREGRVAELKREVNALAVRLDQPPPYPSAETP